MKFANKEFKDYWKIIKVPTYVLIAWSVLGFIISIISFSLYTTIFSPLASWFLMLAVFGFLGWTTIKDHKETTKIAAWSGALAGIISGFVGAILSIVMINFVPAALQLALAQVSQGGATQISEGFIKIATYFSLITGPLFSAIIGAIIAVIAALIAKKI